MPISLVLADDHPILLHGLESLLRLEKDIQVLASCRDGVETLRAVREHQPDILILDLRMPRMDGLAVLQAMKMDGLAVLQAMKKERLRTRVVLLTVALNEDEVLEAIRLGVRGVVLKEMAPQLIVQCVRKVHAGGEWLERNSVGRAVEKMLRREAGVQEIAALLTPRELEIVRLVASGQRNKEIAGKLTMSEGTVKLHLHNIYGKLGVDGRVALTLYARDKALV